MRKIEEYTFFRVGIGVISLLYFLSYIFDFYFFHGENPLLPSDIQLYLFADKYSIFNSIENILKSFFNSYFYIIIASIKIIFLLLLISGKFIILSSIISIIVHLLLLNSSIAFSYGVDYFITMSLFYCFIFALILGKNQNNVIKHTKFREKFGLVLFIHLSIIYFFSGLEKSLGHNWWNGESIWKAVNLPYFNTDLQFNFVVFAKAKFIFSMIGILTIIIEIFYPFFVYFSKIRNIWIGLTVFMHLCIGIILNLYAFSAILIIWNISLFLIYRKLPKTKYNNFRMNYIE